MRTQWLKENKRLVSQDNFGNDLTAVEAAMKKHEAIESDIHVSEVCTVCLWFKSMRA
jgi:spectrin beta